MSLDLVGGQFSTEGDERALSESPSFDATEPEVGLHASWELAEDGLRLGCLLTFGTFFPEEGPYTITGRFRLVYEVRPGPALDEPALEQFVYWNAFFHAWPYWREYLSTLLMRSWVPKFIAPVLLLPTDPGD